VDATVVSDQGAATAHVKFATHGATSVDCCHGVTANDGEGITTDVRTHGAS
jgi:hypothetical protein